MSNVAQRSFSAGEVAPALYARTDTVRYATGLRTCRNWMVMRHGGISNRPGSEFTCEVQDSDRRVRLIKFVFNADQTYVLEFGHLYIRFIRAGAQLVVSGVSAWVDDTEYAVGNLVVHGGVNYYAYVAHLSRDDSAVLAPWADDTPYTTGDRVEHDSVDYVALVDHQSIEAGQTFTTWADDTAYTIGDRVTYNGVNYEALVSHQSLDESTSLPDWTDLTSYTAGDRISHLGSGWRCISSHTSSVNDEPGVGVNYTTYWEPIVRSEPNVSAQWQTFWAVLVDNEPGVSAAWEQYWEILYANEPGVGADWEDFWHALTDDIYEIPTPYTEAQLPELQVVQSADVITIVHPSHAVRELARFGHTLWTLSVVTFTPDISAPTNVAVSGGSGSANQWVVTAVKEETYEESLASSAVGSSSVATTGSPRTISWVAVSGAVEYNVYKLLNGRYGFVGVAGGTSFVDNGIEPDTSLTPPVARNPFNATDDYPSAVAYYQQRQLFANTNNKPETVWGSRTANFHNFTVSSPLQDDDAVTFTLAGRQVSDVRHMVDIGRLIVLTSNGAWSIEGDEAGILRPGEVNPRQQSYHGSSQVAPLILGQNLLFIQARSATVRDLFSDPIEGYRGNDLTIFSAHLFDGYSLADWDYQEIPHSIAWAVRSDGTLLGLTYIPEHSIVGWHRHDTDGVYENVCTVPEGEENRVYTVVRRTINGVTKRYIERWATRRVLPSTILDACFLDCSLAYDGRNTNLSHTMTLSGGTTWTVDEQLTLTSSAAFFVSGDVGNAIFMTDADGAQLRLAIESYTSSTVVKVRPHRTVPVAMRGAAQTVWSRAVDQVTGLSHLEGKTVGVFADGFVVASPNNPSYPTVTVVSGAVTLPAPYAVIRVGLSYVSDAETLDIDLPQGVSLKDKQMHVGRVNLIVESARGIFAGLDENTLSEFKLRATEAYSEPVSLKTETISVTIASKWNNSGRVLVRQVDPVPAAILAAIPQGLLPV